MNKVEEPIIIAEAGINHGGDLDKAIQLISEAHECGADFVKFHAAYAKTLVDPEKYNKLWHENHGDDELFSQFVDRVEFNKQQFEELYKFATELSINFMVTPYDLPALEQTLDIGIKSIKFASCDIVKDDYIKIATENADLLVLATGMADETEIEHALSLVDRDKTYILHCISEYPAPVLSTNLAYIETLKSKYGVKAGFSDHTDDIIVPLLAIANGALMIEKHFMLENDPEAPDIKVSVTKKEMAKLVYYAKNIETIIGSGVKTLSESELKNREKFRYRWK